METNSHNEGVKKSPFDTMTKDELISKCKGLLTIAQKAKQAKSDLQNEVDNYKHLLKSFEIENKTCKENIIILQELVDSLTNQKLNFITELDNGQGKIKELVIKCKELEKQVNDLKEDISVKDKTAIVTIQKLSDLDSEVISLKRQNDRLIEDNDHLLKQLTDNESKTAELNNIGLQQHQQLQKIEAKLEFDDKNKNIIDQLKSDLNLLQDELKQKNELLLNNKNKITEITQFCKNEKEKSNAKLKSYREKIMKCAACINQLKNSRFILEKTVKDYSENIPKWQKDLEKASKVLDGQIRNLNNENIELKNEISQLQLKLKENDIPSNEQTSLINEFEKEKQTLNIEISELKRKINDICTDHNTVQIELNDLKLKYKDVIENNLTSVTRENEQLKEKLNDVTLTNKNLNEKLSQIKLESKNDTSNAGNMENLCLQLKSLESEKATLVREKLTARDNCIELENQNQNLLKQIDKLKMDIDTIKAQNVALTQQNKTLKTNNKFENENNELKHNLVSMQQQFESLRKDYNELQDMNSILKEEVDTLKLSLEQPNDDTDNLSDLNVSLQADIGKLENKLAAYKQENRSLLAEIKESRSKIKECDSLSVEYQENNSKLASYKAENSELLNEMKEINQVLKERGETISKLQKAMAEMERLIDTLEKDRDKSNEEKNEMFKKINSLESDLKLAQKNNSEQEISTSISDKDTLLKLTEKDMIINVLKEDIEKIKQQSSAELPNDDNMSTSTISKADENSRMKDLDETFEDRYTKLRMFALKLKKKLNETVILLQKAESDKIKLEKSLKECDNTKSSADEVDHAHINESEIKKKFLNDDEAMKLSGVIENLKGELDSANQQLQTEIEAHKLTKENLEKVRRDVKKKNVLSLEMEDYERSMKELTNKMEINKNKMIQMESTIDTQEGTITAMKTQIKLLQDQVKTEESQNEAMRQELQNIFEEIKEKDLTIQTKNNIVTKLEQELEDEKRKNEDFNIQMTTLISDKEVTMMNLGEEKVELNNKLKKMEFKCAEYEEKIRNSVMELDDLKMEYTSYKVRAQAMLRQNQPVDHTQEEQLKEETAAMKAQIQTLTGKLATLQEQFTERDKELESFKRRAVESANESTRAHQRTTRLHADLARISQQLDTERTQQKLQISTLTQCYKTQITELEERLSKASEELLKQLAVTQMIDKSGSSDEPNRNQYMMSVIPKEENSDGELDINVSMIPREEGEGSESAPSPPLSKSFLTGGRRSPMPLERLLEEGVPEDEPMDASALALTPDQEISDLKRKLHSQQQRVKHVTVLLSESERECARMYQLAELLKSELRRLKGTTNSAHNAEYMKNVTLKFLALPPGDERSRLVPVLQKILSLTPDETQKIHSVAKGLDPNSNKGWGSYLHWPGGK